MQASCGWFMKGLPLPVPAKNKNRIPSLSTKRWGIQKTPKFHKWGASISRTKVSSVCPSTLKIVGKVSGIVEAASRRFKKNLTA